MQILGFDEKEFLVSHSLTALYFLCWRYMEGECIYWVFLESVSANLYAGAFFQFTTGLMGESSLCIFIKPLIIGGVGLRLMYFHLSSLCIISWQSFITEIIWNFLVGSFIIGTPEVIVWYEVINFSVVFILVNNYYWMTLISLRYHSSLTNISLIWFMVFFSRFLCVMHYMCVSLLVVYTDMLYYVLLGSIYGQQLPIIDILENTLFKILK